jgi:hypothetical protein
MSDSNAPTGNEKIHEASSPERVDSAGQHPEKISWGKAFANQFLAKAPLREAPLIHGGHRPAAEPEKLNLWGVFLKFLTFIGPGVILSIAVNDPDNYQQDIGSGQSDGYTQICPLWVAVAIAIYFQVRYTLLD